MTMKCSFVHVLQEYLTQKSASGNELQIFFQGIRSQLSESMTDVIAKLEEEEVGIVRLTTKLANSTNSGYNHTK